MNHRIRVGNQVIKVCNSGLPADSGLISEVTIEYCRGLSSRAEWARRKNKGRNNKSQRRGEEQRNLSLRLRRN